MNNSIPNFFRFAKSELSQDAFIMWLLEWANPNPDYIKADSNLHKVAQDFVRLLLFPADSKEDLYISSVTYKSQDNNIDVLALITDDVHDKKYTIIIEDKTDTTIHDDQLVRYTEDVMNRNDKLELHCVYFKTGNESKYSLNKIEKNYKDHDWGNRKPTFKILLREDILGVLKPNDELVTNNLIFTDFVNNLDRIQNLTDTYTNHEKAVDEWGNTAWQGFYMKLEDLLNMGTWGCGQGEPEFNAKGSKISQWEFSLPKLSIVEGKNIQVYLHLNLWRLSIKAYCSANCYPKKLKNIEEINNQLAEYGLKIELKGCRKAKNQTLASVKNISGKAFIAKSKPVVLNDIVEKLQLLQSFLPKLAEYVIIK